MVILGVLATGLTGCPPEEPPAPAETWEAIAPETPRPSPSEADGDVDYAYMVRMRMVTISVPLGAASGSEHLWSYLHSESIEAARTGSLGRNGLRVGLVSRENWPDVAAVLDELTGTARKTTVMTCLPGQAVSVALKRDQPMQTVFVFEKDRTLSGQDYPPGDNLLSFFCSMNMNDPSEVTLTAMPQIRTTNRKPEIVKRGDMARIVSRATYFDFEAAAFRAALASRDVLIVGPGQASRRSSSLAHRFLLRQSDGVTYETILVVIPRIFAVPRDRRGSVPAPQG